MSKALVKSAIPEVVEDIYHAKLGWSGASGWMRCSQWQGGGGSSLSSATGTAMHELGAELLTSSGVALHNVGRQYLIDGFTIEIDVDLADAVQDYVDQVKAIHKAKGGHLVVEQSYPIDHITGEPNAISTTDVAIIPDHGDTELVIADLKGGVGVPVQAEDNEQLQGYAISVIDDVSLVREIKTVRMMIIQPRLNSTTEWVQTVEQLDEFRQRAMLAAQAHGTGPATPGTKQCRWCTKKSTCEALNEEVFGAVEVEPEVASESQLSVAMDKVEMIEAWIKAVRAEVERRLLAGESVDGYKLVQGKKGNRKWSDPAAVEQYLKKTVRLKTEQIYDLSLISPASAEKLFKAGSLGERQWTKVREHITQSEGSPSVAPVSDKRPALKLDTEDFQPVDQQEGV